MTIGRFNRILSDAVITVKPITDPEKIGPKAGFNLDQNIWGGKEWLSGGVAMGIKDMR